ncbi:YqaJ viral recombinase family protein [Luteibacter sp.]|jgi:predicted phage-related endonuclease|uniref:YqaJ viral recombinase family protein n=1 Tax=Luteibacter sp. TaxID=1886636 RepID=UPI002F420EA4
MKIHNLIQGTDEWAAFRLNHHGASEAAAMLGLSKRTTRSELLRMKHTGTPKEFSDWVQENILDYGHAVEAMGRPLVEELIGDELYPVTCSDEDVGGHLSASCDGLTIAGDTAFEHKQWNAELAAAVAAGTVPDDHMPQCQQIMMITGADRVIFTVSDGTPDNFVSTEVRPDPAWFERIVDGWAQFDRDLTDYTLPEQKPMLVAESVQALPAVAVQVIGQISVRENFNAFEVALRDFLANKLIREPQTDQDFVDLDQQIKAMKKAEDTLNAAEAMMLAQVESIDQAKRQKDMLAKLVRDNRLMAEKLLESEKTRRRQERIEAARKAYTAHVTDLQSTLTGLRLDVAMPDFAGAIKGLKTLSSIDDKLDTALANGKIAVDRQANELRTKLAWVEANASEYRALLADLQQLSVKPLDDFKLAITARIDAHKRAEEARLEAERQRIRQEEADKLRLEQEAAAAVAAQAEADAEAERLAARDPEPVAHSELPVESPVPVPAVVYRSAARTVESPLPSAGPAKTIKLGDINARIGPLSITADGLASLGFHPVGTERAAKLYAESDLIAIYRGLYGVIQNAANELKKAA